MDYWTGDDKNWREDRQGNIGDADDVWIPGTDKEFTPDSNPSTAGYNNNGTRNYSDDLQNVFTGIAVQNIRQINGEVRVDIRFIPSEPSIVSSSQGTGDHWNEVTLSWTAPAVNNTNINGYEYCSTNCSNNENWTGFPANSVTTNTGRITLPSDANTVEYSFHVRAVTPSEEAGTPSAAVEFTLDRPGAVSLASSGVLNTPRVGDMLTATLADPNLSNSALSWQWQRRIVGVPTWERAAISGATGISYTLTAQDGGHEVRATVSYNDGVGSTADMAASAPVSVPDAPPSAAGAATPSVNEVTDLNATDPVAVGVYRNTDPNPNAPVWSLIGADMRAPRTAAA